MQDDLHTHEAAAADAREFATALIDAHPDPYSGHDGRIEFHRRLTDLVQDIPAEGLSRTALAQRLQQFAARVRDGHTQVVIPDDDQEAEGRLPIDARVVGDALYIDAVYADRYENLLGSRIRTIQGNAIPALREQIAQTTSSDNEYGDRRALCEILGPNPGKLPKLVDSITPTIRVETPTGNRITRELKLVSAETPTATLENSLSLPQTSGEPAYCFHDDAALLRIPDCQTHREAFEAAFKMYDSLPEIYDIQETYERVLGESAPEKEGEAISGLPAATEVFAALVEEMAAKETKTLIVDTRGNGGGSSIAAYMLTYMLHGRDGVAEAAGDQYSVGKHSDLYRAHYGEQGQLQDTPNPEGFDFHDYHTYTDDSDPTVLAELQEMSETIAAELDSNTHAGYYCPEHILVVTDAATFSAGVEIGILLEKLGAQLVGVPSSQSPNGPRDLLTGELTNTGLEYRLSYRYHVFQPDKPGNILHCDTALTPERFEMYNRASDASILLALDTVADHPSITE